MRCENSRDPVVSVSIATLVSRGAPREISILMSIANLMDPSDNLVQGTYEGQCLGLVYDSDNNSTLIK